MFRLSRNPFQKIITGSQAQQYVYPKTWLMFVQNSKKKINNWHSTEYPKQAFLSLYEKNKNALGFKKMTKLSEWTGGQTLLNPIQDIKTERFVGSVSHFHSSWLQSSLLVFL